MGIKNMNKLIKLSIINSLVSLITVCAILPITTSLAYADNIICSSNGYNNNVSNGTTIVGFHNSDNSINIYLNRYNTGSIGLFNLDGLHAIGTWYLPESSETIFQLCLTPTTFTLNKDGSLFYSGSLPPGVRILMATQFSNITSTQFS
jgi:hypothetical protein